MTRALVNQLEVFGDVFYWAQSNLPGQAAWEQIYNWIDNSDIVIVLVTKNTVVRALSVGQEVRRAKEMGKTIIPIVPNNIMPAELWFLSEIPYQPIDLDNPWPVIAKIKQLVYLDDQVQNKKNMALLLAGIAFLIFFSCNMK